MERDSKAWTGEQHTAFGAAIFCDSTSARVGAGDTAIHAVVVRRTLPSA
jgi:hypothetical protein